jgi:1,4-dihydroxy-6-naphthoate synthase
VIRVAHSPDSDDAFMFYALATGQIDTEGLEYVHELQDIETLNQRALRGELEVTAVSIHAYAYIADRYALLPHGSSMGDGYGPRLWWRERRCSSRICAVADRGTGTADHGLPGAPARCAGVRGCSNVFRRDRGRGLAGDVDAGLLIHEGQLTFADRGLHLVADLGVWWQRRPGSPFHSAGTWSGRTSGRTWCGSCRGTCGRASLRSRAPRRRCSHAMTYARGLDEERADDFVGMYVNEWTLDYGEKGAGCAGTACARSRGRA